MSGGRTLAKTFIHIVPPCYHPLQVADYLQLLPELVDQALSRIGDEPGDLTSGSARFVKLPIVLCARKVVKIAEQVSRDSGKDRAGLLKAFGKDEAVQPFDREKTW